MSQIDARLGELFHGQKVLRRDLRQLGFQVFVVRLPWWLQHDMAVALHLCALARQISALGHNHLGVCQHLPPEAGAQQEAAMPRRGVIQHLQGQTAVSRRSNTKTYYRNARFLEKIVGGSLNSCTSWNEAHYRHTMQCEESAGPVLAQGAGMTCRHPTYVSVRRRLSAECAQLTSQGWFMMCSMSLTRAEGTKSSSPASTSMHASGSSSGHRHSRCHTNFRQNDCSPKTLINSQGPDSYKD